MSQQIDNAPSIWLDSLEWNQVESGWLASQAQRLAGVMIAPGQVAGTVARSDVYDDRIRALEAEGRPVRQIAEALLLDNARQAADALQDRYAVSAGATGYVALALNPTMAVAEQGIVAEGLRVAQEVDRPNLMVEVPATGAALAAAETLTGYGINLLVSGIFTPSVYEVAANVYLRGLESFFADRHAGQAPPAGAVRVPGGWLRGAVNGELLRHGHQHRGERATLATAALIHNSYEGLFGGSRWQKLAAAGARPHGLLWDGWPAPHYRETILVLSPAEWDALAQEQTADSFWTEPLAEEDAWHELVALAESGLNLTELAERLRQETVSSLREEYQELSEAIMERRMRFAFP